MDYSLLYKKVAPSIVNVVGVNKNGNVVKWGTGAIIDDGSKVITCSHCLDVSFRNCIYDKNTNQIKQGSIIFNDKDLDVAILDMGINVGNPLPIKSSNSLEIGNEVFTVGFPYTFPGEKTLTSGNVAAFENKLIKIDTSVNNGNSGGPLLNTNGEIIGVVNAKLGNLSKFLDDVEKTKQSASIVIGTIDPVVVIQQMIREMKLNLNLGIGYAVPSDEIAKISSLVKAIII